MILETATETQSSEAIAVLGTGGPRIVRILGSQRMILLERLFFEKKGKKPYYIGEFVLFSTLLNRTIPGIVLSEIVLSGDPLYHIIRGLIVFYHFYSRHFF